MPFCFVTWLIYRKNKTELSSMFQKMIKLGETVHIVSQDSGTHSVCKPKESHLPLSEYNDSKTAEREEKVSDAQAPVVYEAGPLLSPKENSALKKPHYQQMQTWSTCVCYDQYKYHCWYIYKTVTTLLFSRRNFGKSATKNMILQYFISLWHCCISARVNSVSNIKVKW